MEDLKYTEILVRNRALKQSLGGPSYSISVLSNVTVNSLKEILEYNLRLNRINAEVTLGNYDNIVQDSVTHASSDLVVIFYEMLNIIDGIGISDTDEERYQGMKKKITDEVDIIFKNLSKTPLVIFNRFSASYFPSGLFADSRLETFAEELNHYVDEKKNSNVSVADLSKVMMTVGLKQSYDLRLFASSKAPYTLTFLKQYVRAIQPEVLRVTGKLKKALIFDCDNTLWGGILGEDGPGKIDMSPGSPVGRWFHEVQKTAVYLSQRGVIIGICSKNNPQDVIEVLRTHPDVILKENFIVIKKVNWDDKATNLRAIASELNIGLDSLLFVDDSAFEINLVREQLPDVAVLQVPERLYDYPGNLMREVYSYFNLEANAEDVKKTEMYKQQFQREASKSTFGSVEDYLASLEIGLTIHRDEAAFLQRISQLTLKTNQFNLTTRRYTESQIQEFIEGKGAHVFSVSVKDKFGDNGLTALCIVTTDDAKREAVIDTFLMSCRIIGRSIEFQILHYVLTWLRDNRYKTAHAEFIPTKKNAQVETFYETFGFGLVSSEPGKKLYALDLSTYIGKTIEYVRLNSIPV